VSGDFTDGLVQQIRKDFGALPAGSGDTPKVQAPSPVQGMSAVLVEKETGATAISFGFPIPFTRADSDYYAMLIMNAWLGQHRNSFSHLYQMMRGARGLNYGDYSYIEHFPQGGSHFEPLPNVARHQQIFQVWIRPVQNANRHFALRQAVREVRNLIENGMTKEDFALARNFVLNNTVNLALSNSDQLGYALDDRFYGLKEPFLEQVKTRVPALKLEEVNAAIKKYLSAQNLVIAAVTQDAAAYKQALVENTPSPIHYDSAKPQQLLDEDKIIKSYPLSLKAEAVTIVPTDQMFQ
jgi:zinc protease